MKLLALSDIHGYTKQIPLLANIARDCDAILLAGDITDFGGANQARLVLSALDTFGKPVLAVPGNCDLPQVDTVLKSQNSNLVHNPVEINGFVFVGFSYEVSLGTTLPKDFLSEIPSDVPMVLVTHQPAWGTNLDLQALTRHKGSHSVRSFIEDYQPVLAVSGHIHEARGTDRIGSTLLVNPGPFRNGCYAVIDIRNNIADATLNFL